jgi:hypothetical protein
VCLIFVSDHQNSHLMALHAVQKVGEKLVGVLVCLRIANVLKTKLYCDRRKY